MSKWDRAQLARAERRFAAAREELTRLTREVDRLPGAIQRGDVAPAVLAEALRLRESAALLVAQGEAALAEARAYLADLRGERGPWEELEKGA